MAGRTDYRVPGNAVAITSGSSPAVACISARPRNAANNSAPRSARSLRILGSARTPPTSGSSPRSGASPNAKNGVSAVVNSPAPSGSLRNQLGICSTAFAMPCTSDRSASSPARLNPMSATSADLRPQHAPPFRYEFTRPRLTMLAAWSSARRLQGQATLRPSPPPPACRPRISYSPATRVKASTSEKIVRPPLPLGQCNAFFRPGRGGCRV